MDPPLGYHTKGENLVCKLKKFIYGLCQTFLQWFHKFTSTIISAGFNQSKFDYSLFYASLGDSYVALLVYVDDIIIVSKDSAAITSVQVSLQNLFKLKVLGNLKYFLGLEIASSKEVICLSQHNYTLSLLEDIGFANSKPTSLPIDPNIKLNVVDGEP